MAVVRKNDLYLLSRDLPQNDFPCRSGLVGILERVDNDVHHVANDSLGFYIGILVYHEEKIHQITSGSEVFCSVIVSLAPDY